MNQRHPAQVATLMNAIRGHIDMHSTLGQAWPDDAEYAVAYRYSTWPIGWDDHTTLKFFTSKEELDLWFNAFVDWAKMEDNDFACRAWKWDLGPNRIFEYDRWETMIHSTAI